MKYYPRSGPEITMEYTPPKGGVVTNGYIDTSSWQVKNHPPPLDPVLKKKKKQLPKIDFSSLGSKLKRGGQGGEEKDEGEMKANDPSNVNSGGRASGGGTLFGQQMGYEGENIEDREPDSDDEDIHLPPPVRKSSASSAAAPVSNNISAKSIGSLEATSARQQRSKTEEERNQASLACLVNIILYLPISSARKLKTFSSNNLPCSKVKKKRRLMAGQ